ncbi:class I SAM-dependent DNA methyltransferase [Candidatus Pantoea multigeneris]|uniref:site-specific DNA-methyltransferase (adenine-specific) n=1 Tax=Candidatus Pantoea multigeneris TaxID=2608357 RepID=A0ABX0R6G7_9GAMM|nr:DNA methyltransferase [Pantoea multigeneris]NIF20991.1 class I SAM-dependent DNA methyltransferase [Pantoea multigeneris]
MNIAQVEEKVKALVSNLEQNDFLYNLLDCYDKSKASITRLKMTGKGSYNLSKNADEVLWKKQVYYKATNSDKLLSIIDEMKHADVVAKHRPRFIIAINASHLLAIDTKTEDTLDIPLAELNKKFDFFLPWANLEKNQARSENLADVKAAEKMAKLFDLLRANNPATTAEEIHWQNVFLSRILFCYFAEDTGIFNSKLFTNHVASHTAEDGNDLSDYLSRVFDVMNQECREGVPEYLADFPYVNGGLFADKLPVPTFTRKSRAILIDCGADLNWSEINPDIFGSMIQAVVDPGQRSNMGMHYTNESNIRKVLDPLFLNELKEEFEKHSDSRAKLEQLLLRLEHLKIFDPACGSGNFLIIAYKELRQFEMKIFKRIQELTPEGIFPFSRIKLSQFYGIELDDFAHEIAILSLWLAEHQMNLKFKEIFGHCNPALPLKSSGNVVSDNAIHVDWDVFLAPKKEHETYVLGNPPYLGARNQEPEQKIDLELIFEGHEEYKDSDYVCCWFIKAAQFIAGKNAKYAFVATNSICQGEQVSYLWPRVFQPGLEIDFAYTSFKWSNFAKNNAGVTCVIVGVRNSAEKAKLLFGADSYKIVKEINPYLIEGKDIYVRRTSEILSGFPAMSIGCMARDGGNLILKPSERDTIVQLYPQSKPLFKKLYGTQEFIGGNPRQCLWIENEQLDLARSIPPIKARIDACYDFRMKSKAKTTNGYAKIAHKFAQRVQGKGGSIIVPKTSSERREYVPIGYMDKDSVITDAAFVIFKQDPALFGIISSKLHGLWIRTVGGQLETRLRYSVEIVYNTFPFPDVSEKKQLAVAEKAMAIVAIREDYPELSIEDLYDPDTMPADLKQAHYELDVVVEQCYQIKPFYNDIERLECLFKLYEKMMEAKHA